MLSLNVWTFKFNLYFIINLAKNDYLVEVNVFGLQTE